MAGWASNSKYPFLGALRSAAQMVSLRSLDRLRHHHRAALRRLAQPDRRSSRRSRRALVLRIPLLPDVRRSSSSRRWPRPTARRSTCRKARVELVAGYFVEYSSMTFALFFLGEYANMILMCAMTAILFLGGWLPPIRRRAASPGSRARSGSRSRSALVPVRLPLGAGDRPALPLRPADAARLEGVPAAVAGLGRADRRRADRFRLAAELLMPSMQRHGRDRSTAAARSLLLAELRLGHGADPAATSSSRR